MKLLVFAHPGEAQSFLNRYSFHSTNEGALANILYHGKEVDLLLTGEGPLEALSKVSIAASLKKYDEIINFGLCAGLRENITIGEIYQIRSVFAHTGHSPIFQSFTLEGADTKNRSIDITTSFERILDQDKAQELSVFSPLVDREAYGVAKASALLSTRCSIYKIVSDLPHESSKKANLCEDIKEKASIYSEKLYLFYKNNLTHKSYDLKNEVSPIDKYYNDLVAHPHLHFTFSMSKRLKKQLHSLELKSKHGQLQRPLENIIETNLYKTTLIEKSLKSKERANFLLDSFSEELAPFKSKIDKELKLFFEDLEKKNIQIKLDKNYEREGFGLNFWIQSEQDKQKLLSSLEKIKLSELTSLQRGIFKEESID